MSIFALLLHMLSASAELDLLYGHYELQIDYSVPDGGSMSVSYNQTNDFNDPSQARRLDGETTRIVVPPVAQRKTTAAVSFLGEPAGSPFWLLPQNFQEGNHFFGMRVIAPPFVFQSRVGNNYFPLGQGSVGVRLLGVTGTGPDRGGTFAVWEGDPFGGALVYYNTADGIDSQDDLPVLPATSHSHFNWGFTQPGSYRVEFEAYGRLANGQDVSWQQALHFIVPHSGTVEVLDARICQKDERWELVLGDEEKGVVYRAEQGFLKVTKTVGSGGQAGWWESEVRLGLAGWAVPDVVGLPVDLAGSGVQRNFAGGVRLRLIEHEGPGEVLLKEGESVRWQSSDGLGLADALLLRASTVFTGQLFFSQAGLHSLAWVAEGLNASGQVVQTSAPLRLRVGVNLGPEASYPEWAESWERALALPVGTLADPAGDWDRDGFSNLGEYLHEAAGARPHRGETLGRIEIEPEGTHVRFLFLRDLYRGNLDGRGPELQAGAADDFQNWEYLSPFNPGLPLGYFETSQEEGNAWSLFMMRALRRELPFSRSGGFRFRTTMAD